MIIALGVMMVTSLLMVAAFTAANGDIRLSHQDLTQKQAYYAALGGIQQYEYKLQANPSYWQTCEGPKGTVPEEANESYEVTLLPASSSTAKSCETANPFSSMIESKGAVANTFRIKSTGTAGTNTRSVVATFKVSGFLDYVYYTNFETEDPKLYEAPAGCAETYYKTWNPKNLDCAVIHFADGDVVNGPMHTNDSAYVGETTFGRSGHEPADVVEINGGTYTSPGNTPSPAPSSGSCPGEGTYNTASKCYTAGATLVPPQSDTSLLSYVESKNLFAGLTRLVLNGSANTIAVTYYKYNGSAYTETKETINWPENGLIYVKSATSGPACAYAYMSPKSDSLAEEENEKGCGNVYVSGTYSKSLTIGAENDLIINNNIYPSSLAGKLGNAPPGTASLGLIASNNVRVYHPVGETYTKSSGSKCKEKEYGKKHAIKDVELSSTKCEYTNEILQFGSEEVNACNAPDATGTLENPWIYAAILSTAHSFAVDNFACGEQLGNLHVYGAIAQNYRGIVGTGGGTGYIKDYKYDERLATDEPPYFLAPLKSGWKIARETAP